MLEEFAFIAEYLDSSLPLGGVQNQSRPKCYTMVHNSPVSGHTILIHFPSHLTTHQNMAVPLPRIDWLKIEAQKSACRVRIFTADKIKDSLTKSILYAEYQSEWLHLLAKIESTRRIYVPKGSGPGKWKLRWRRFYLKTWKFLRFTIGRNFGRAFNVFVTVALLEALFANIRRCL